MEKSKLNRHEKVIKAAFQALAMQRGQIDCLEQPVGPDLVELS